MSAEKLPLPPLPQHQFARRLEGLQADPHGSVIEMEKSLHIEIGGWLGFRRGMVREEPEAFQQERLSVTQYEAIKSFEEMVHLFSAHGTAVPRRIGRWLERDNPAFHGSYPMKILFGEFASNGLDKDDIRRVVYAAHPIFLQIDPGEALQEYISIVAR